MLTYKYEYNTINGTKQISRNSYNQKFSCKSAEIRGERYGTGTKECTRSRQRSHDTQYPTYLDNSVPNLTPNELTERHLQ